MEHFYIYLHRRLDTGMPFYIGKGKGYRLRVTQHRNQYWINIATKGGWAAEIFADNLDEEFAHFIETELIDKYRRIGISLTNLTDGGEGMSGFSFSEDSLKRRADKQRGQIRPTVSKALKGIPKSQSHRDKLSIAKSGQKASIKTRLKMSDTRKAMHISMVECSHCGKTMNRMSAHRWHLEKCKEQS